MNNKTIPFTRESRIMIENVTRRSIIGEANNMTTWWLGKITGRPLASGRDFKLEELLDADNDIIIFSNDQLNILNPSRLYSQGLFSNIIGLFRHFRETKLHCLDNTKIQ